MNCIKIYFFLLFILGSRLTSGQIDYADIQRKISDIRSSIEEKNQLPIDLVDLIYMFEKVSRSWADIADLVKPIYN